MSKLKYSTFADESSPESRVYSADTKLPKLYIVNSWIVKRGRDKEFVAAWKAFAKWLVSQKGSMGSTRLFKDDLDPAHYLSVDSWENGAVHAAFRRGVQFGKQSYRLQKLTIDFSSWTLTLEAEETLQPQPPTRRIVSSDTG